MVVSDRQLTSAYSQGPDKLVPIPQEGFRNGDLARQDDEGYVYITDRKKDIIIIMGGLNIASLDITSCLLEHADVADAGTLGVKDEIYGEGFPGDSSRCAPGGACPRPRCSSTVVASLSPSRCRRRRSSSTRCRRTPTASSTATRWPQSGSGSSAAPELRRWNAPHDTA